MAKLIKTKLKQFFNFLINGTELKEGQSYTVLPSNKAL